MSYVHGTSRIFGHCTFQWYERQSDGERIAQVEPHHCERCVAELRRSAKIEGLPLRWPAGTQPPPAVRSPSTSLPIVLAEDDDETRDAMTAILREDGYGVKAVGNGREALAALLEVGDPCLLLLDLRMPILSGWDVLRVMRLHRRFVRVPVVVISGEKVKTPLERCDHLLEKPVSAATLLSTVSLCAARARRRDLVER